MVCLDLPGRSHSKPRDVSGVWTERWRHYGRRQRSHLCLDQGQHRRVRRRQPGVGEHASRTRGTPSAFYI